MMTVVELSGRSVREFQKSDRDLAFRSIKGFQK